MDFQGLVAWQRAMDLCHEIYRITERFPRKEIFGLSAQMRDAALSVPSNVAEGEGRRSRGERKQFLGHARGSLYELETQLLVAKRVGYEPPENIFKVLKQTKAALEGYIRFVEKN